MTRVKSQSSRLDILQKIDEVGNRLRELREQVDYVKLIESASILDNYVHTQYALVLNAVVSIESDGERALAFDSQTKAVHNFSVALLYDNSAYRSERANADSEEMLVANVDIVKSVDDAIHPSIVRLNGGHKHIEDFGMRCGIYLNTVKGVCQLLTGVTDGEIGVAQISGDTFFHSDSDPSVVESGSKIVQSVSRYEGELLASSSEIRRRVLDNLVSNVTVYVGPRSLLLYQIPNDFLSITNMFVGPINLESGILEENAHGVDSTGANLG